MFVASIYINAACYSGPHLDAAKIRALARVVGPDELSRVLRDTVQGIVDCARITKNVFAILRARRGDGDVVIRGTDRFNKLLLVIMAISTCFNNIYITVLHIYSK